MKKSGSGRLGLLLEIAVGDVQTFSLHMWSSCPVGQSFGFDWCRLLGVPQRLSCLSLPASALEDLMVSGSSTLIASWLWWHTWLVLVSSLCPVKWHCLPEWQQSPCAQPPFRSCDLTFDKLPGLRQHWKGGKKEKKIFHKRLNSLNSACVYSQALVHFKLQPRC